MKPTYTKKDIQMVLNYLAKSNSIRKTKSEFGVSHFILYNCTKGHISRQEAYIPQQRLSTVQEERLTKWVLVQESLGLKPTFGQIKVFAERILYTRGDIVLLGKRWIAGFLRRNPILRTKKQFYIDSARVNSTTTEIIKK
jgi:hypothetical protein